MYARMKLVFALPREKIIRQFYRLQIGTYPGMHNYSTVHIHCDVTRDATVYGVFGLWPGRVVSP